MEPTLSSPHLFHADLPASVIGDCEVRAGLECEAAGLGECCQHIRGVDESGNEIARGVINYNAQEARRIVKLPTGQIAAVLGYIDEPELVHRDNLVLD